MSLDLTTATTVGTAVATTIGCLPAVAEWVLIVNEIFEGLKTNAVVVAGTMVSPSGPVTGTGTLT